MKQLKKTLVCAMLVCGMLAMTGCTQKQPEQIPAGQAPAAQTQQAAKTANDVVAPTPEITMAEPGNDAVLVTVNGVGITRAEADDMAGRLMSVYASYGMDTTSAEAVSGLRQLAMNTAVQMQLMLQKGEEWGVAVLSEAELKELTDMNHSEWENVVSYYVQSAGVTDASTEEEKTTARENALAQLAAMGYTEQFMLDSTVNSAKLEKVQAEMVKDIEVTEEEVIAAYTAQVQADEAAYKDDIYQYELNTQYLGKASYFVPAGYRGVTQILLAVDEQLLNDYQALNAKLEEQVETGSEATATDLAVTREQVEAVREAILQSVQPTVDEIREAMAGGAAFDSLIDQYNTDPGMQDANNRRNGYSVHMDSVMYDPAFVQAAFSVSEQGEVSEPTVGSFGVYLVCYLRDVPAGAVELDTVRAEITESVLAERENEVFNSTMNAWMEAAQIEMTEAGQAYMGK